MHSNLELHPLHLARAPSLAGQVSFLLKQQKDQPLPSDAVGWKWTFLIGCLESDPWSFGAKNKLTAAI